MRPFPDEILRSMRFSLQTYVIPHVNDKWGSYAGRVAPAVRSGAVAPVIGDMFSIDAVADAHNFMAQRKSVGRTVVVIGKHSETAATQ